MPTQVKSQTKHTWLRPTIVSAIFAAILFVIANSAFWVNNYIFDTNNFSSVATTSLTSESSRDAIASEITDKLLSDYPTAKNIAGNTITKVVSGVLGTDQVENVLGKAISKLQVSFTSSDPQSLTIDLQGPKEFITKVVDVVSTQRQVKINPDNIPSEIVLVNKDNIPDFYKYGIVFLWLGPIALIGAIVLVAYPYVKWHKNYKVIMMIQAGALLGAGLLALLLGPLFRPPVLSKVPSPDARTVVSNLYNAFIGTFNNQTQILIVVAVLVLAVGGVLLIVPNIRRKVQAKKA